MPKKGDSGVVRIAGSHARLLTVLFVCVAAFTPPWCLLWLMTRGHPTLLPVAQHVLNIIAFAAAAAVFIWGSSRSWLMELRIDGRGVTIRDFRRMRQFSWAEVSCFKDGWVHEASEGAGADFWALDVVLHDGTVVTARPTMSKKGRPKTLMAIQQAAAVYGIPAELTGKAAKPATG